MKNSTIKIMTICLLLLCAFTKSNAQFINNFPTQNTTNGNIVGIGNYFAIPNPAAYLLDTDSGDINIGRSGVTDKFGYRIGHNYVLWNNGNVRNIYVGVNAGKVNAAATAINNTFCGYDAGNMDSTGFSNSFFGYNACSCTRNETIISYETI